MKKVLSRVLAVVICLAMVFEGQAMNVWASEILDKSQLANKDIILDLCENNDQDTISESAKFKKNDSFDDSVSGNFPSINNDLVEYGPVESSQQEHGLFDGSRSNGLIIYGSGETTVQKDGIALGGTKSLKDVKEMFPKGKYWNHIVSSEADYGDNLKKMSNGEYDNRFADDWTNSPCDNHNGSPAIGGVDCNVFDGELQCRGFASRVAYLIYGSKYNSWSRASIEDIKAGDVLIYHREGDTSINGIDITGGFGHTVFVTSRDGNTITVGEANNGENCRILWDRSFDINTTWGTTVYSAPYELISTNNKSSIDYPQDRTSIKKATGNSLFIKGWLSPNEGFLSVEIFIDGVKKTTLTEYNSGIYSRDDVEEGARGYHSSIIVGNLETGSHTLNIKANYSSGLVDDLGTRTFIIDELPNATKIGDNVYFRVQIPGEKLPMTCIIYGTGPMYDRKFENNKLTGCDILQLMKEAYEEKYNNWIPEVKDCRVIIQEGVTSIGDHAFSSGSLLWISDISIPSSLESIGDYSLSGEHLSSIVIPGTVKHIGDYSFQGCDKLKEVVLENGISFIGENAFSGTAIETITVPKSVEQEGQLPTGLSNYVFGSCKNLKSVQFEGKIVDLPSSIFSGCINLQTVKFADGLESIGYHAFYNSGIKEWIVPEGVAYIASGAFDGSKLEKIELPESLSLLNGFEYCQNLDTVIIKSVDTIYGTFRGCKSLKELFIPEGCTYLSQYAFTDSGLEKIYIPQSIQNLTYEVPYDFGPVREGDTNVEILGATGSYAEKYAQLYDYRFTATDLLPLSSIILSPSNLELCAGQEKSIKISTNNGSVVSDKLIYKIDNPSIASVVKNESDNITVKGIAKGSTKITFSVDDVKASAIVTVVAPTIQFKDQDGSNLDIEPIEAVFNQKYPELPIPTKEGFEFVGWYTKPDFKGSFITSGSIFEGEDVLYATWLKDDTELRTVAIDEYKYTGNKICPDVKIFNGISLLTPMGDYTISYKNNINAYTLAEGDTGFDPKKAPSIIVTGKGNYDSKETVYFKILPPDIGGGEFSADDITLAVIGKAQKVNPELYWNGKKLKNKKDYTFAVYKESDKSLSKPLGESVSEAGSYVIRLTGNANFTGTRDVNLTLTSDYKLVNTLKIGKVPTEKYTGSAIKPEPEVRDGNTILTKDAHYTLSYDSNVNAGTGYVIIKGIPEKGYAGCKRIGFKINGPKSAKASAYDISEMKDTEHRITVTCEESVPFMKGGAEPAVTVTYKDETGNINTLIEGIDYNLKYKNNTTLGGSKKPAVEVIGTGNYKGKRECPFKIEEKNINLVTLLVDDVVFKNKANSYAPKMILTDENGKALKAGMDYEKEPDYSYVNDTKVTVNGSTVTRSAGETVDKEDIIPVNTVIKATVKAKKGSGYTGSVSGEYIIKNASISSAKVSIPIQIYTGKPITLSKNYIDVNLKGQKLADTDYEIVGYSNNKDKGTANVTLRGVGNYGGLKTQTFKIKAKGFRWWWRK